MLACFNNGDDADDVMHMRSQRDRCYNYESELDIDQINISDSEANVNSHLMTSAAVRHSLPVGMTDSQISGSLVGDTDFDPGSDPEHLPLFSDDVTTPPRDRSLYKRRRSSEDMLRRANEYSDDENES